MTRGGGRPRVWGVGTARTMRVHWMLAELGVEYETREIIPRTDSMQNPEFLRVSERGKVPILEDGELVIGESGAIVTYLADHYRGRVALAPEPATIERARFDELCFYALTELDAPLYVIRRHEGLPEVYGESKTAVRSAGEYYLRQTSEITRRLSDGRPYLLGDEFGAADLLLATCSAWARVVGIELPDPLAHHLERATDRDAYRSAVPCNFTPAALEMLQRGGMRAGQVASS